MRTSNTFKVLIPSVLISVLSANAQAKIYPDQLVTDQLGEDVCRTGYRPIDRFEANAQKDYIVSRMGQWQITGLKDDWVIMGPGYHGRIKQDTPNSTTWCYPVNAVSEITTMPKASIPEGDEVDIQYALVTDHANFVRPLSYLAHYLGYAWVSGNHSQFVGEDMDVRREGDGWVIQGNKDGSCDGYRCDEKSKITINNFAYTLNNSDFSHGDITESDRQLVKTVTAIARNRSDIPQQVVVDLSLDESTNWSKTDTYGFAQSVSTENEFMWPLVGKTKLSISIEANQSFSNTNGASTSQQVTLQARPTVPANSEIPIRVELYRSSISYPYSFGADVSYDVTFDGFLRWSGNAWHSHPDDRPNVKHTFTMGRGSDKSADIRYQWDHRYIPGEVKWWDWSWAITENGLENMQTVTGESLRPFYSRVSGDFNAESQFAGTIEIGQATPISNRVKRSAEPLVSEQVGDVEITTNFDAQELAELGFTDAHLSITPAE
ncbi:aerolysin family beta-barrel pore-forming toxin [Vibrio tetraodonis]|uniref:aerolysin family beta-barrel pore-forming toxin n=1 Tax=Vibrio tetraodonis TaxID=2231647 RepID=UPI000E0C04F3|nr:aerolysin family beta-barrel pore-forming toxin [Vibrio tetraodonis]